MKTSKLKKNNVKGKLSITSKLYDKTIKMPSKYHKTIALRKGRKEEGLQSKGTFSGMVSTKDKIS
jgi:hypothetical protein